MKVLKFFLVATIFLSNFALSETLKEKDWFNPSVKNCVKYGGKLTKEGVCQASWSDAKTICTLSKGRLPNIKELRQILTDCGGALSQPEYNENNIKYKECYQKLGFINSIGAHYYWSSTEEYKWLYYTMDIGSGFETTSWKIDSTNYAICIKK